MHIKKFTQFIVENEHYGSINEGDIVPGVTFNSGLSVGSADNRMTVDSIKEYTQINFIRKSGADGKARVVFAISFPAKPLTIYNGNAKAYAYVVKDKLEPGANERDYLAIVSKMEDFNATKSSSNLQMGSNSIDLMAEFITSAGIVNDTTQCTKLAQVIAELYLNPKYKTQVTETFKKFANNLIDNTSNRGFTTRMSDSFLSVKQSKGMIAFRDQLPKSYEALSKTKTADATKK
jgi:hypothetical protein